MAPLNATAPTCVASGPMLKTFVMLTANSFSTLKLNFPTLPEESNMNARSRPRSGHSVCRGVGGGVRREEMNNILQRYVHKCCVYFLSCKVHILYLWFYTVHACVCVCVCSLILLCVCYCLVTKVPHNSECANNLLTYLLLSTSMPFMASIQPN